MSRSKSSSHKTLLDVKAQTDISTVTTGDANTSLDNTGHPDKSPTEDLPDLNNVIHQRT